MKHTPGPWEILKHCNDRRNDNEAVGVGTDDGIVADVWRDGCMRKSGRSNASLIAAAPELLEAAKKVLDGLNRRIEWSAAHEPNRVPVFDGVADLHSAIRKAEGAS